MKNRIREIRKHANLSQTAFGAKIGVTLGVIKNFEQGKTTLDSPLLELLCSIYNVNENWLRTGEGEMFVKNTELDNHELSPHATLILQNFLELSKSEQDEFIKLAEQIYNENSENGKKTVKKEKNMETFRLAADSGEREDVSYHMDEEN